VAGGVEPIGSGWLAFGGGRSGGCGRGGGGGGVDGFGIALFDEVIVAEIAADTENGEQSEDFDRLERPVLFGAGIELEFADGDIAFAGFSGLLSVLFGG